MGRSQQGLGSEMGQDARAGAPSCNPRYFPLPVYQSWADVVFLSRSNRAPLYASRG